MHQLLTSIVKHLQGTYELVVCSITKQDCDWQQHAQEAGQSNSLRPGLYSGLLREVYCLVWVNLCCVLVYVHVCQQVQALHTVDWPHAPSEGPIL